MKKNHRRAARLLLLLAPFFMAVMVALAQGPASQIGKEISVPKHLQDGQEFQVSIPQLIQFGQQLFNAKWTIQEGQGRPLSKGTGPALSDLTSPLVFPRNFDRLSSPEANSCSGCHNGPRAGGGGDRVSEVFVLGQRFDFLTFDHSDLIPTRGAVDELGNFVTMYNAFDERKTIGMFGSGFLEMVARQMTFDLQGERDACAAGSSCALSSKGVTFGTITHNSDGTWDTSQVVGMVAPSTATKNASGNPITPNLIIRPYHQASNVVSVRQFTNNAFNHHHGIQSEERFGLNTDPDGDGFVNELTTADMTAISMFQATLPVPGQVIPNNAAVQQAVMNGQTLFNSIGCASCHATLPLNNTNPWLSGNQPGWIYFEPDPYNPTTGGSAPNLTLGPVNYPISAPALTVDLTSNQLPGPRLQPVIGPDGNPVVMVPAFTDLKVHDITCSTTQASNGLCVFPDPNAEPLNQNAPAGSTGFFGGNTRFITRKLWGLYNQGPFFHHGKFTTVREAIENHFGEAEGTREAFNGLTTDQRNDVIEYLKSLRVLPPGATALVVDQNGRAVSK